MITFDQFQMQGDSPIYAQIVSYIKRGIIAGSIRDGDELPSRRVLSATLGVNPMTIQKAYKQLEDERLILSRAGAKSYVSVTEELLHRVREELLEDDTLAAIGKLKLTGLSKEDVHGLIDKYWDQE